VKTRPRFLRHGTGKKVLCPRAKPDTCIALTVSPDGERYPFHRDKRYGRSAVDPGVRSQQLTGSKCPLEILAPVCDLYDFSDDAGDALEGPRCLLPDFTKTNA